MGKCNVEVFSRVTGFFRPVQAWNEGKTEEFKDRKTFKLKENQHDRAKETAARVQ